MENAYLHDGESESERKNVTTTANRKQAAEFEFYYGRRRYSVALQIGMTEMMERRRGGGMEIKLADKTSRLARALERLSRSGIDISDLLPAAQIQNNLESVRE